MRKLDKTLMTLTLTMTNVSRAYKSVADKLAADYQLSQATAWPVLMIGRLGDGARPGAVAQALGLDPSSVVRLVDHLVEAGLVMRGEDRHDRRARTLHLTEEGKERAQQIEQALIRLRRTLFDGMDEAEVDTCLKVLLALGTRIEELDRQPGQAGD